MCSLLSTAKGFSRVLRNDSIAILRERRKNESVESELVYTMFRVIMIYIEL